MASTLSWLDYSEKERRKNLDIISLFKNQDTRDELGLGTIRDAFADALFPGTGTVQTRARYFLFIPWIYLALERRQLSSREIGDKARTDEIKLIFALEKSGEEDGVIGIEAREKLQRLPSNIYWLGLGEWGIRLARGSQFEYHRSIDRWYKARIADRNDDKEPIEGRLRPNWNSQIPLPPKDFPGKANFLLTKPEAVFLRDQILLRKRQSLLSFLVNSTRIIDQVEFPWMHPQYSDFPARNKMQLLHARNFSEIMHGSALLYNLMLAELTKNESRMVHYKELLSEWGRLVAGEIGNLRAWPRNEFWAVVREFASVSSRTRDFVNSWVDLVLEQERAVRITSSPHARALLRFREIDLKRNLARLENVSARETWSGAAGAGQIEYRWSNAQVIVNDILQGMTGGGLNA